jgi:hypothetical protein
MHDIRFEGPKDSAQTWWKVSLFQDMQGAPLADVIQQGSDFLEFVHYHCPIILVLVYFLSLNS